MFGLSIVAATCLNVAAYVVAARATHLDRAWFWIALAAAAFVWAPKQLPSVQASTASSSLLSAPRAALSAIVLWALFFGKAVGWNAVVEYGMGAWLIVLLLVVFVMLGVVAIHFASGGRFLAFKSNERIIK